MGKCISMVIFVPYVQRCVTTARETSNTWVTRLPTLTIKHARARLTTMWTTTSTRRPSLSGTPLLCVLIVCTFCPLVHRLQFPQHKNKQQSHTNLCTCSDTETGTFNRVAEHIFSRTPFVCMSRICHLNVWFKINLAHPEHNPSIHTLHTSEDFF